MAKTRFTRLGSFRHRVRGKTKSRSGYGRGFDFEIDPLPPTIDLNNNVTINIYATLSTLTAANFTVTCTPSVGADITPNSITSSGAQPNSNIPSDYQYLFVVLFNSMNAGNYTCTATGSYAGGGSPSVVTITFDFEIADVAAGNGYNE